MRKHGTLLRLVATVLVPATLALLACAVETGEGDALLPDSQTQVSAEPEPEPSVEDEVSIEDIVRVTLTVNGLSGASGLPDDLIQEFGVEICDLARESSTGDDFALSVLTASIIGESDFTVYELAIVTGAVAGVYCPEQLDRLGITS